MLNSSDQDEARHFVGPELGPNCLQMFSADGTNVKQRVKISHKISYLLSFPSEFSRS